ncbi:jg14833, partial [Pararge aegeria aegeria]
MKPLMSALYRPHREVYSIGRSSRPDVSRHRESSRPRHLDNVSYQERIIEDVDGDKVKYRMKEYLEFDEEASFPLTLDDEVTIVNVAYH